MTLSLLNLKVNIEDRWNYQYPQRGPLAHCTLLIDTTECPVASTSAATYSGYKKNNTFKYEAAVGITSGKFHWAPIPGDTGPTADETVFKKNNITRFLQNNEFILGDGKYKNVSHAIPHHEETKKIRQQVRSLIENAFGRLKHFHCLVYPWRHSLEKHHVVFRVCIHITNITIDFKPLRKNAIKYCF